MPLEFQPRLEERCLGQITRNPTKPYIIEERGDCRVCSYDSENNKKCKAYTPIVVRFFEVVE